MKDALQTLKRNGKLTFWCMGVGKLCDRPRCDRDNDSEDSELTSQGPAKKMKLITTSEERATRVSELKAQLCQKHRAKYSNVQHSYIMG